MQIELLFFLFRVPTALHSESSFFLLLAWLLRLSNRVELWSFTVMFVRIFVATLALGVAAGGWSRKLRLTVQRLADPTVRSISPCDSKRNTIMTSVSSSSLSAAGGTCAANKCDLAQGSCFDFPKALHQRRSSAARTSALHGHCEDFVGNKSKDTIQSSPWESTI